MPGSPRHALIPYIRRLAGPEPIGGLSDGQLLECYVSRHDQAAFELLLWRHGPMVLGTCRRLLSHTQDVEDAFQATFLVLARKAATVRKRGCLGSWLHRVAYRLALRTRTESARRGLVERPGP